MDLRHRNNVNVMGNGSSTLVFSHGFGCNQAMWNYLLPYFVERFRVVVYDLVGAGLSAPAAYDKEKYACLGGYAADLNEIIDEFAHGPVVLVGHSVSAMIGTLADRAAPGRIAVLHRHRRLRGRIPARRHPVIARHPRQQLSGLVQHHGAADHGRTGATGPQ